ncbi:MAG: hypothetical protein K6T65_04740 [Peptococcaceae bacterium]|nr:hypothetical protein [Peptococcaceae bacterium]
MFEFVSLVVFANLILLACLYFLRRLIDVRVPVLFIAVVISVFFCILYPFLATIVTYPQIIYLYIGLILAGAGLLYWVESKLISGEVRENKYSGVSVGDTLAVVEGGGPAMEINGGVFRDYGKRSGVQDTDKPVATGLTAVLPEESVPANLYETPAVLMVPETEMKDIETPVVYVEGPAEEMAAWEGPRLEEAAWEEPPVEAAEEAAAEEEQPAGEVVAEEMPLETAAVEEPEGEPVEIEEPPGGPMEVEAEAAGEPAVEALHYSFRDDELDMSGVVARAFDVLATGNRIGAAETFFRALKLNPPPKLAALLCIEISSIYLIEGNIKQALTVIEMVEDVWGSVLDEKDLARVKSIKNQLRSEIE